MTGLNILKALLVFNGILQYDNFSCDYLIIPVINNRCFYLFKSAFFGYFVEVLYSNIFAMTCFVSGEAYYDSCVFWEEGCDFF